MCVLNVTIFGILPLRKVQKTQSITETMRGNCANHAQLSSTDVRCAVNHSKCLLGFTLQSANKKATDELNEALKVKRLIRRLKNNLNLKSKFERRKNQWSQTAAHTTRGTEFMCF